MITNAVTDLRIKELKERLIELEVSNANLKDGTKLIPALNAISKAINEANYGTAQKLIFSLIAEVSADKYV
jgi:hypothetical protein